MAGRRQIKWHKRERERESSIEKSEEKNVKEKKRWKMVVVQSGWRRGSMKRRSERETKSNFTFAKL